MVKTFSIIGDRQSGKTTLVKDYMNNFIINNPYKKIVIAVRNWDVKLKEWDYCEKCDNIKVIITTSRPKGLVADLLIIDDFELIDKEFFFSCLMPIVSSTDGLIVLVGDGSWV